MLVHKLVRKFPKMCRGHKPPAGSAAATRRVTNIRFKHVGRRSKACKKGAGYVK